MAAVTVRMYRLGLGDCFLLTFPTGDSNRPFHMLVDCGVVNRHKAERRGHACPSLAQVVQDISSETGGIIDVLVVTHEHEDHIIGFDKPETRPILRDLTIKQLWLAWTEDPDDADAKRLQAELHKANQGLQAALSRANARAAQHISGMLDLFGADRTKQAMDAVRALLKQGTPCYLDPSKLDKPLALADVPGVRIYVLGPPREEKRIRKMEPGKGQDYLAQAAGGPALTPTRAFLMAAYSAEPRTLPDQDKELFELSFPFDRHLRIPRSEAEGDEFFQSHYYRVSDWRRIDHDWLGTGEELSLDLGTYTNNTSLALAIELTNSGQVLVLAADAQVGNWMSWRTSWKVVNDGVEETVELEQLLKRAVLYKVGHHGSHNASYKPYVDLMTSPSLVSMIPFDQVDAEAMAWPNMLSARLVKWLSGQQDGRGAKRVVVRLDRMPTDKPKAIKSADWKAFQSKYRENDLYMEYTVAD